MTKGKQPHPLQKPVHLSSQVIALSVAGVLIIALALVSLPTFLSFLATMQRRLLTVRHVYPATSPVPTQTPTISPTPWPPRTFTSPDLGISFDYSPMNGTVAEPIEIGNRIIVAPNPSNPTAGFSLEVDTKNPSDSITDAIRKKFMQGIIPSDCQVEVISNPSSSKHWRETAPRSYVFAVVRLTSTAGLNIGEIADHLSNCAPGMPNVGSGGLRYFMMDTNHPDKILFVNVGESALLAGYSDDQVTWNDTIRFTDSTQ